MSRTASPIKGMTKQLWIDEHTIAEVELRLFSEVEGKVPYGAWKTLVTELLREWVKRPQQIAEFQKNLKPLTATDLYTAEEQILLMKVELTKFGYRFD